MSFFVPQFYSENAGFGLDELWDPATLAFHELEIITISPGHFTNALALPSGTCV